MAKAKYSDGDWIVDFDQKQTEIYTDYGSEGWKTIARVYGMQMESPDAPIVEMAQEEEDANALMLSAAPDLAKALHDALQGIEGWQDIMEKSLGKQNYDRIVGNAKAALKKADFMK